MNIRRALVEDAGAIAALLMLATGEVIRRLIGVENQAKSQDLLLHFVKEEYGQYSFQNCHVAEEAGEIIGTLLSYDGAKLEELRKPFLDYIHEHFNPLAIVEDETQAGEYYIDSLAVSPWHQGKGTGSRLLHHLIQEKTASEFKTLGLLVDKSNPDAKRLYLKLGFKPVGEKVLSGISLEHLQLEIS